MCINANINGQKLNNFEILLIINIEAGKSFSNRLNDSPFNYM